MSSLLRDPNYWASSFRSQVGYSTDLGWRSVLGAAASGDDNWADNNGYGSSVNDARKAGASTVMSEYNVRYDSDMTALRRAREAGEMAQRDKRIAGEDPEDEKKRRPKAAVPTSGGKRVGLGSLVITRSNSLGTGLTPGQGLTVGR